MADAGADTYDEKISGNLLVLGSMGCGKTSLGHTMGCNGMFGQLKKVPRISKVDLSEVEKVDIDSCIKAEVKFYNPLTSWQTYFLHQVYDYLSKLSYMPLYGLHNTATRAILSQTQIFCIFPPAANLAIIHLVNFVICSKVSYIAKQKIWLTKLFWKLGNQTG